MNFLKTLPIHIFAKKSKSWERLEGKCNLPNIYDGSANFRDSPKVWQMKLRLWHVILHENGQCLLGTKKIGNYAKCRCWNLFKLAHYFSRYSECKPMSNIDWLIWHSAMIRNPDNIEIVLKIASKYHLPSLSVQGSHRRYQHRDHCKEPNMCCPSKFAFIERITSKFENLTPLMCNLLHTTPKKSIYL